MSLAFQCKDVIHGGDSLSLGVLGVGDGFADDVLKEDLQNTTGLFVDETWDALDSTASHKADGGIDDAVWYPREWLYYTKQSVNKTNFVREY